MRKHLHFAGLGLCAVTAAASAQQDGIRPATVAEEPARYAVEIIVFAYEDTSSAGNEVFTPPAPIEDLARNPFADSLPGAGLEEGPVFDDRAPPPTDAAPVADRVGDRVGDQVGNRAGDLPAGSPEEIAPRARIELERLDPAAHRLQAIWRKLEQLDVYRPILHAAWTQTTHEKSVSPELPLRIVSDPPLGLDGSINLYQSRFLHLDVDLTLDASGYVSGDARRSATDRLVRGEQDGTAGEGRSGSTEAGGIQLPPLRYHITEDRIMRDGEIRYFDHPRFGVLATVRRVEDAPPGGAL